MPEKIVPGQANTIELFAQPFAKAQAEKLGERQEKFSPAYPHLFLSTLFHNIVQGHANFECATVEYLENEGLKDPILQAFTDAAREIRDQFQARTGVPYERVTWVNEVPFCTTPNQVRIINALCGPETPDEVRHQLDERAGANKAANVLELASQLIRDPNRCVTIKDRSYTQADLLRFYRSMMRSPLKDTVSGGSDGENEDATTEPRSFVDRLLLQNPDRQFAALMASFISYYYFPFAGAEFAEGLASKRKLAMFNARTDQIGFLPVRRAGETDAELAERQELINAALPAFSHHLNNKVMLQPVDVAALSKLVRAVKKGDVAFFLHEIKTEMFYSRLVKMDGDEKKRVWPTFTASQVEPKHLRDIAHSVTAMFFGLQNLVMHPAGGHEGTSGFAMLMSDDYEARQAAFAALLLDYRHFFWEPSRVVLTKLYFPVINEIEPPKREDPTEEVKPVYVLDGRLAGQIKPVTSSVRVAPVDLLKAAVRHAHTLFMEVQKGERNKTPVGEILT